MAWFGNGFSQITGQISNLTKEVLTESTEEIDDHATKLHICKSKYAELENICQAQKAKIDRLHEHNCELAEKLESSELQTSTMSAQYRHKLDRKDEEIRSLKQKQSELEEDLRNPALGSSTGLSHSCSAPSMYTTEFPDNDVDDAISSQHEINQLRMKIHSLEKECRHWQDTSQNAGRVSGDESLEEEEEETITSLRQLVKDLQHQLDDGLNRHQHELAALQNAYTEKIQHAKRKNKETAETESIQGGEMKRLRDEVNHLNSINNKLHTDLELTHAADREKARRLDAVCSQLQDQQAQIDRLTSEERSHDSERQDFLAELDALTAERQQLKLHVQRLQEKVSAQMSTDEATIAESSKRESGLSESAADRIAQYEEQISQFELQKLDWEIEKETLEEALNMAQQRMPKHHTDNHVDIQQELAKERKKVAELKARLSRYAENAIDDDDDDDSLADKLEGEIERRQDSIESLSTQINKIRHSEASWNKERDRLTASLAASRSETDTLQASLEQLDEQHITALTQLVESRDQLKSRVAQLEKDAVDNDRLSSELADVKSEYRAVLRALEHGLADLRPKILEEVGQHSMVLERAQTLQVQLDHALETLEQCASMSGAEAIAQKLREESAYAEDSQQRSAACEKRVQDLEAELEQARNDSNRVQLAEVEQTGLMEKDSGSSREELMDKELLSLQKQVDDFEQEMVRMKKEICCCEAERAKFSDERDAALNRVRELECERVVLVQERACTHECVTQAQNLKADVHQFVKTHEMDRSRLLAHLENAETRLTNAESSQQRVVAQFSAESTRLKARISELESNVISDGEREQMVSVLSEKTRECAQLKAEQQQLLAALAKQDEDGDEMGKEAVRRLSSIIRERDDEIAALHQRTNSLLDVLQRDSETDSDAVKQLLQERDMLTKQVSALQSERVQLSALLNGKHEESVIFHAEAERLTRLLAEERHQRAQLLQQQRSKPVQSAGSTSPDEDTDSSNHYHGVMVDCETKAIQTGISAAETNALIDEITSLREMIQKLQQGHDDDDGGGGEGEEMEELRSQLSDVKMERDELELALQQTDSEQLYAKIQQLTEQDRKQTRELDRLRRHLVSIEENYTREALEAEEREKCVRDKLAIAEDKLLSSSSAVQSASEEASERLAVLELQLHTMAEQRDNALLQLASAHASTKQYAASLSNLQSVLEQFQQEREKQQAVEVERYEKEIESCNQQIVQLTEHTCNLQSQLDDTCEALEAASRLSEQLDRKEEIISALREEVQLRESELQAVESDIQKLRGCSDEKVDRDLLKNLLIGYFHTPSNKRNEVLKLICNVLAFTDEEVKKIGVESNAGWLGSLLRRPQRSASSSSQSDFGLLDKSFSELFVKFLERESSPPPVVHLPVDPPTRGRSTVNPFAVPITPINPSNRTSGKPLNPTLNPTLRSELLDSAVSLPLFTLNTPPDSASSTAILRDVLQ